jgi:hypothetical protein
MPEFKDISQFSVVKPVGNEKIQVSATQSVTLQSIADLAPTADLSDYAKKTDLDSYAKKTDLDSYAKKTDLDSYAKKTDLDSYAKKTDLDSYAKKTDLTSINNDIDDLTSEVGTKKDKYNFKTMASGNFNISGGDILHINNSALACTNITIKASTFTDTNPIAYIIQPILNAGGTFNLFSFVFDTGSFDMYQVGYKEQSSIQSDGARLIKLIKTNLGFVLEYQYLTPYYDECQ